MVILIFIYVDDILVTGSGFKSLDNFIQEFNVIVMPKDSEGA